MTLALSCLSGSKWPPRADGSMGLMLCLLPVLLAQLRPLTNASRCHSIKPQLPSLSLSRSLLILYAGSFLLPLVPLVPHQHTIHVVPAQRRSSSSRRRRRSRLLVLSANLSWLCVRRALLSPPSPLAAVSDTNTSRGSSCIQTRYAPSQFHALKVSSVRVSICFPCLRLLLLFSSLPIRPPIIGVNAWQSNSSIRPSPTPPPPLYLAPVYYVKRPHWIETSSSSILPTLPHHLTTASRHG